MTEIQIAWLELMTVGGLGVILVSGKWKGVSNRGVLCEWNLL